MQKWHGKAPNQMRHGARHEAGRRKGANAHTQRDRDRSLRRAVKDDSREISGNLARSRKAARQRKDLFSLRGNRKKTSFGWTRIALPHEAYASCHPGLLFQGACQRPAQWTWWSFGADGEASSSDFERSAAPGRAMAASPFQSVRSRRAAAASTARNAHHRSEANRAAAQGRRAEEDLHAGASRRDHRHAPRRIARVALEKR